MGHILRVTILYLPGMYVLTTLKQKEPQVSTFASNIQQTYLSNHFQSFIVSQIETVYLRTVK